MDTETLDKLYLETEMPHMIKRCVICGKEFQAKQRNVLTCSTECSQARKIHQTKNWRTYRHANRMTRVCIICGSEFKVIHTWTIVCSSKCRRVRRVQTASEWNKTNCDHVNKLRRRRRLHDEIYRERCKEAQRRSAKKNCEQRKQRYKPERRRAYHEANRESNNERDRAWYKANRERISDRTRKRYQEQMLCYSALKELGVAFDHLPTMLQRLRFSRQVVLQHFPEVLPASNQKEIGLDIMKRPVHVVPVWSKQKRGFIENVWPSINEIQVTAARTNAWAGMDRPEFGPTIKRSFSGLKTVWIDRQESQQPVTIEIEIPEWCEVTVYRLVQGARCAFCEPVYWLEAYARMGQTSELPTDMWIKRPRGQLIKVAKAFSLRAAFPEEAEYSAEEMAGQSIDGEDEPLSPPRPASPPSPPAPAAGLKPCAAMIGTEPRKTTAFSNWLHPQV